MLLTARVLETFPGNRYLLLVNQQIHQSAGSKKLAQVYCGDFVLWDSAKNYVVEIIRRTNLLGRPKIANIDQVLITSSFAQPALSSFLINSMILHYSYHQIALVLLFTKKDLDNLQNQKLLNDYQQAGYKVMIIDHHHSLPQEQLTWLFANKTTIISGQSGVGKSSLIQRLIPDLQIKTNAISSKLKRGKNTTNSSRLYQILGGLVADTPGFSQIHLTCSPEEMSNLFIDFAHYQRHCQFHNCLHFKEKKCFVKEMVGDKILASRYHDYLTILQKNLGEKKW